MKSIFLFFAFVGLFTSTTLTLATTTSSSSSSSKNIDPSSTSFPVNVFRPVSAIVTRKGGAIATIRAVLDPPIDSDGYKDITLSWCSRDDWSDCLDPSSESYSSNISRDCRCTSPGSSVEDTLRFGLIDDKEQQQNHLHHQSQSNDLASPRPQKCSVVSHRWEENTQVQDLVSSPYKKIADKAQKSIRKLERELEDKVKEFNEKFLEQQVLSITSSNNDDGEHDDDDDDEKEDEAKSLLFGNNDNKKKNKNSNDNNNNKKSKKNKKNSLADYLSGMKTLEKYITVQKEKIAKFRTAVAQSNIFLNNLAATGSSSSGDHTSQTLERRLRHSAGRVLKVRLFCNHSSTSSSFSEIFAQVNLPEAQWTPTHTLLINTNENNGTLPSSSSTTANENNNNKINSKNDKPTTTKNAKASASSEVRMAARISQQTYVDWQNVRLSLRQGAPGEDSTTTEQPPEDGQATAPWIVKIATVPPPNYEKIVEQRRSVPMNTTTTTSSRTASISKSVSESMTDSASRSATMSSTATATATSAPSPPPSHPHKEQDSVEEEQEENSSDEQQEQNSDSSITSMLGSGFTEETKLPHLVSIPKHSSAVTTEIGTGKITTTMHRVVAGFRCRQQQQASSSSNKENFGCTLPVFLRANISNADNSFYILGGPTRIIVDGVPFVSASSGGDLKKVVTKPIFQKSIAPGSWGWVNLGEDTKVTVQRYEKSSVMRRVLNKDTGKTKNWWENIFTSEEAEKQEAEKKKQDAEKKANNTVAIKFEIKITNSRTIPITIDLRDQYPRSNTDEIEVRLSSETLKNRFLVTSTYSSEETKENKKNESANSPAQQGEKKRVTMNDSEEIHWKVHVDAGQTVVIPFGFYLTWNKDKFVHGLV